MANFWRVVLTFAISAQLAACEPGVRGVVLDGATEAPVADATVGLRSRNFSPGDDQVIWDKDYVETAQTASNGSFSFESTHGIELSVRARDRATELSSVCSKSPMIVRIGGPFAHATRKQLLLGEVHGDKVLGWDFEAGPVLAANADLSLKALPDPGQSNVRFLAPLGMSFKAGTGNPPMPPAKGYVPELELDMMNCGWLFVKTRQSGIVGVQTGQLAIGSFSGAGTQLAITYVLP
jgi:hypothetical protein